MTALPLPAFDDRSDVVEQTLKPLITHARSVITETLILAKRPVFATNFRPGSVVLLDLLRHRAPEIPVIWVDTGQNTPATYRAIDALQAAWNLDLRVYTPRVSEARRAARGQTRPDATAESFKQFVEEVKLEPFRRAFTELEPDFWFTGIRRDQTEFRANAQTYSNGVAGSVKVAPLLDWTQADIDAYVDAHDLPDNQDYVDPTKPGEQLECGIQLLK